jgi:hypothetical protein
LGGPDILTVAGAFGTAALILPSAPRMARACSVFGARCRGAMRGDLSSPTSSSRSRLRSLSGRGERQGCCVSEGGHQQAGADVASLLLLLRRRQLLLRCAGAWWIWGEGYVASVVSIRGSGVRVLFPLGPETITRIGMGLATVRSRGRMRARGGDAEQVQRCGIAWTMPRVFCVRLGLVRRAARDLLRSRIADKAAVQLISDKKTRDKASGQIACPVEPPVLRSAAFVCRFGLRGLGGQPSAC